MSGVTPCRQLRPSSRRENIQKQSNTQRQGGSSPNWGGGGVVGKEQPRHEKAIPVGDVPSGLQQYISTTHVKTGGLIRSPPFPGISADISHV